MKISNKLKYFLSDYEDLINEGNIDRLYNLAYEEYMISTEDILKLNEIIIKTKIGKIPEKYLLLQKVIGKEGTVHDIYVDGWDKYNGTKCKILETNYLGYYNNGLSQVENFNNFTWLVLMMPPNRDNFKLNGILGKQIKLDEPLED